MIFDTLADARTWVNNSGVIDWDWGDEYDPEFVLELLANYAYRNSGMRDENDLLWYFLMDVLGEDPSEYGLMPP